jgi:hypothetical protein
MNEDLRIIICISEDDANAERIKCQTALGQSVDVTVRPLKGLPVMNPVSFGPKPVVYSILLSDQLDSAWVVTVQKK